MALRILRLFQRRHAAGWTFLGGLALTAGLTWILHHEAAELDRQRMVQRALEIKTVLDARLERSEMLLQNLRDFLTLSGESRQRVFARWCYDNGMSIVCPWILGIGVATNRNEVNLPTNLTHPPTNWTIGDWEALKATAWRHRIEFQFGMRSNVEEGRRFLEDYDLRCDLSDRNPTNAPSNQSRLGAAILESSLGMSHRQPVMLDANDNPVIGTSFYLPIYRPELGEFIAAKGADVNSYRFARWLHVSAVIVAPVDFNRLIRKVEIEASDLGVEIFSSTNQLTAETWMNPDRLTPRADDPAFSGALTHRETWPMYRQRWTLFFYTRPLFKAQSPHRLARTAGWAGLAITLLATALVGVSVRARNRQDHLTRQIREARDALAAAQREREKISRDLHDGTIQSLYAIQLGLARTAGRLRSESVDAGSELSGMRQELDAVIAEIRQFITVEAEADKAVDLCGVLQAIAQRARTGTTARIGVQCDPFASARVTGNQAVQLANIAREGLSNALRHGRPQRVDVHLRLDSDAVLLEVADDGTGFSPSAAKQTGLGLISMSTRATEAGGTFDVNSSPGQGTRLVVRLPVPPVEVTDTASPDLPDTTP